MTVDASTITDLRGKLRKEVKAHSPKLDTFLYNGGTALALAATGAATLIPTSHAIWAIGLILFCAFAFAVNDTTLRSTLIGGIVASVGSAIAFYFSSKSADKARQDIVNAAAGTEANAASGTEMVPSLIGESKNEAAQMLGKTTFRLIERSGGPPGDNVTEQHPPANTYAPRGSSVLVILAAQPPPAG